MTTKNLNLIKTKQYSIVARSIWVRNNILESIYLNNRSLFHSMVPHTKCSSVISRKFSSLSRDNKWIYSFYYYRKNKLLVNNSINNSRFYSTSNLSSDLLKITPSKFIYSKDPRISINFSFYNLVLNNFLKKISDKLHLSAVYTVYVKVRYNEDNFFTHFYHERYHYVIFIVINILMCINWYERS